MPALHSHHLAGAPPRACCPSCVHIAVVSASGNDLENQPIFSLLETVDPERERTLGVLTQCDQPSEAFRTQLDDILSNKRFQVERSWGNSSARRLSGQLADCGRAFDPDCTHIGRLRMGGPVAPQPRAISAAPAVPAACQRTPYSADWHPKAARVPPERAGDGLQARPAQASAGGHQGAADGAARPRHVGILAGALQGAALAHPSRMCACRAHRPPRPLMGVPH